MMKTEEPRLSQLLKGTAPKSSTKQTEESISLASIEDVLAQDKLQLENEKLREEIEGIKQDRQERKDYANRIYKLVCRFLSGIGAIIFLAGFSPWGFHLSDVVITTLLATTTAKVLALFYFVARYLYAPRPNKSYSELR